MLTLNIIPLLQAQGKTKYWLYKQLGMSYQNFKKMIEHQTKSIQFEKIEILCLHLNCMPNDLFLINFEQEENN